MDNIDFNAEKMNIDVTSSNAEQKLKKTIKKKGQSSKTKNLVSDENSE